MGVSTSFGGAELERKGAVHGESEFFNRLLETSGVIVPAKPCQRSSELFIPFSKDDNFYNVVD